MTVRPAGSASPVSAPSRTEPSASIRGDRPASELVDRFTTALRRRDLPLTGRGAEPRTARTGVAPAHDDLRIPVPAAPRQGRPLPEPGHSLRRPAQDPEAPEIAGFAAAAPMAAPPIAPPPTAPVDPSAFADLMNQLWLREQNRQTREMKVRFGDAAWPATGASLLRLDDGSLSITVEIARHGDAGDLEALRRQLQDHGIPVAVLAVSAER